MKNFLACGMFLFAVALAVLGPATPASAQRSGDRDDREERRDRGDRDRGDRRGRGDRGDRSGRFEEAMKRWDKNDDGYLTQDEAPERVWEFLKRRAGKDEASKLKIDDLINSRRDRDRDDRDSQEEEPTTPGFGSDSDSDSDSESPKVKGFDEPIDSPAKSENRRDSARSKFRDKARRYARGLLGRYDSNRNGILERDEWRRISGSPEKADANGDGAITYDELTARLENNYRKDEKEKRNDRSKGRERSRKEESSRSREKSDAEKSKQVRSYRFTPAHERLPEGLPSWFEDRDKDGDGQVAMHEYSRSWSDRKTAEFNRYDQDGDGVLTPQEMVRKR